MRYADLCPQDRTPLCFVDDTMILGDKDEASGRRGLGSLLGRQKTSANWSGLCYLCETRRSKKFGFVSASFQ